MDRQQILALAQSMAALVDSVDAQHGWSADEARAFRIMNRIVFFQGTVLVDGTEMDRPCCDQDDAVFYWEIAEFLINTQDDVHANTFFHDCWHVVQFRAAGNTYAYTEAEKVEREVDATTRQIEVARKLGCSADEVDYLIRFSSNREAIVTGWPRAWAPIRCRPMPPRRIVPARCRSRARSDRAEARVRLPPAFSAINPLSYGDVSHGQ